MPQVKTLIVHADPTVRHELRQGLAPCRDLRVLGEAVAAFEALELYEAVDYGAFFIQADLPGQMSGMELAQTLAARRPCPALVLVAADEALACRAFELGAADYLRRPFSPERLALTGARIKALAPGFRQAQPAGSWAQERSASAQDEERTVQVPLREDEEGPLVSALQKAWDITRKPLAADLDKLPITQDGRTLLLPYTQVLFVEADEDYCFVHTAQRRYLTSYRLKNLQERLEPHGFFRVHRKYLVNLEAVTEIAGQPGGAFLLRTQGKTRIELPISRRRIGELKQVLGL